jgi:hypothetical protein
VGENFSPSSVGQDDRFAGGFFGLVFCGAAWRGVSCLFRLESELVVVLG